MAAIDSGCKKAFALWHRRAGKDVVLWNMIIKKAVEQVGLYFYFLPTYTQGKKIIWDGINNDGFKFIDYIPEELIVSKNGQEMKIELWNGSIIQIIGTDHYDSIRGTNPRGCVFSEYAFQHPLAWEVVKPILKVNKGWAVFNTTPNGKNHAYDLYQSAQGDPSWFSERLTIQDTGVLGYEDIEEERRDGMTEEMIQQEYYCSFDVGALGSYYSDQVRDAHEENRICRVPYEKHVMVSCWMDLGRTDSTSIIFAQIIGKEVRIIDFFEDHGKDISHYVQTLRERGFEYDTLYLPHDARQKRLEAKNSIEATLQEAGFKTKMVPNVKIELGIQKVRKLFPRIFFDSEKCIGLIRALENYQRDYDERGKVFKNQPRHDWSSHAADSLRYLSVSLTEEINDDYESVANQFTNYEKQDKISNILQQGYKRMDQYESAVEDFLT